MVYKIDYCFLSSEKNLNEEVLSSQLLHFGAYKKLGKDTLGMAIFLL